MSIVKFGPTKEVRKNYTVFDRMDEDKKRLLGMLMGSLIPLLDTATDDERTVIDCIVANIYEGWRPESEEGTKVLRLHN